MRTTTLWSVGEGVGACIGRWGGVRGALGCRDACAAEERLYLGHLLDDEFCSWVFVGTLGPIEERSGTYVRSGRGPARVAAAVLAS